jgi:hypothetical protein
MAPTKKTAKSKGKEKEKEKESPETSTGGKAEKIQMALKPFLVSHASPSLET